MIRPDPESFRLPYVSVLVPVRNEGRELAECLESIAAQTYPVERFEVILADASDVPLSPARVPNGIDARIVPNPERIMSRGLNLVANSARGSYLAIVSAHSTIPPEYLERMVRVVRESGAANVGSRIRKVGRSRLGRAIAAATSSPLGVGTGVQHHGHRPGPADSAFPGFIDRSMFDRLGGFNPELACNEDDEFNARVRAAGGAVWYEPGVQVTYRPRETVAGLLSQQYRYGRWKVAVARQGVPAYIRPHHVVPGLTVLTAFGLLIASAFWPPALFALIVGGLLYVGLVAWQSRGLARSFDTDAWRVAAVFPMIHVAYGLGFLRGLLDRELPEEGARSHSVKGARAG